MCVLHICNLFSFSGLKDQNHINCLLKQLVTQFFPVSISPFCWKNRTSFPSSCGITVRVSNKACVSDSTISEKMWHKCLIKCIYYLSFQQNLLAVLLNSSHHHMQHYSSFRKYEYCLLIIYLCSNNTIFFSVVGKGITAIIISLDPFIPSSGQPRKLSQCYHVYVNFHVTLLEIA